MVGILWMGLVTQKTEWLEGWNFPTPSTDLQGGKGGWRLNSTKLLPDEIQGASWVVDTLRSWDSPANRGQEISIPSPHRLPPYAALPLALPELFPL